MSRPPQGIPPNTIQLHGGGGSCIAQDPAHDLSASYGCEDRVLHHSDPNRSTNKSFNYRRKMRKTARKARTARRAGRTVSQTSEPTSTLECCPSPKPSPLPADEASETSRAFFPPDKPHADVQVSLEGVSSHHHHNHPLVSYPAIPLTEITAHPRQQMPRRKVGPGWWIATTQMTPRRRVADETERDDGTTAESPPPTRT